MPKQRPIRFSDKLDEQLEAFAKARGMTVSALVREAARSYLDEETRIARLDELEERLVATLNRHSKEARLTRNDLHMLMAMMDTLVRLYLLHTPPVPQDAIKAAAASADERHKRYSAGWIESLQGESGFLALLAKAAGSDPADAA